MKKMLKSLSSQLVLVATIVALILVVSPHSLRALTSARSQTANLSSATAGTAILLRNGEQISYSVASGNNPNVYTAELKKSCDGANFSSLSVAISTANNLHASTFSGGPIPVENCPGGKVWYRFEITSYTSGLSSTTITEADNIVRSFLNSNGESVLDVYDGGIKSNGYLLFAPKIYTKAQIGSLVPLYVGQTITCSDCNFAYNDCKSSGTAAGQWFALKTSTGGVNGGGTHQDGCGPGQ